MDKLKRGIYFFKMQNFYCDVVAFHDKDANKLGDVARQTSKSILQTAFLAIPQSIENQRIANIEKAL